MPEGGSRHTEKSRLGHKHTRTFLLRQPKQLSEPPVSLNYPNKPQLSPLPMDPLAFKLSSGLSLSYFVGVTIFSPGSALDLHHSLVSLPVSELLTLDWIRPLALRWVLLGRAFPLLLSPLVTPHPPLGSSPALPEGRERVSGRMETCVSES